MKILALDVARLTGFAVGNSGFKPRYWSADLGASHDRRFCSALRTANNLVSKYEPDLVVIEDVVGRAKTPHVNVGIISCFRGVMCDRGVKLEMCSISQVRKHFLGFAPSKKKHFPGMSAGQATKALKQLIMDRCGLLGWSTDDPDAADALALWDFACATYAPRYQAKTVGGLV